VLADQVHAAGRTREEGRRVAWESGRELADGLRIHLPDPSPHAASSSSYASGPDVILPPALPTRTPAGRASKEDDPMKHSFQLMSAVALVACGALLVVAASRPQDKSGAKQPPAGEDPAMMEKMMKLAMPGDAHKALAKQAGTWQTHYKMRMSPDMPWMESDGTAEKKAVLGAATSRRPSRSP